MIFLKNSKLFIACTLLFAAFSPAFSQINYPVNTFGYKFLDYQQNYLPENLLESRSAIFISTPENSGRDKWKRLADQAHEVFKKTGIDAVAYFRLEDVLAGPQATGNFAENLNQRKIENLILLSEIRENGENSYVIIITSFNGKPSLVDHNQQARLYSHQEMDRMLLGLYRTVANSGQEVKNLLILDQPEYFTDIRLIQGRRFETFQQDLKLDKLAVPLFQAYEAPSNYTDHPLNHAVAGWINRRNEQVDQWNQKLSEIMKQYPFDYELIDMTEKTADQLRNEGFQFILHHLDASGKTIKKLLDYNTEQVETDYISVSAGSDGFSLKTIPVGNTVYKYYIQHIFTSDIFLGTKWDADADWDQALLNHISGLKEELGIN